MRAHNEALLDVVGIGFGPSNLAVAIAIEEHNWASAPNAQITARFFEKKDKFGWHPGMLLPGTTMQVSFLKDLVTQRDATSSYTFLNYLAQRGRLTHFINRQDFFPLRDEFHDYLEWAADRVEIPVDYSAEITDIDWDGTAFVLTAPCGESVRARSVVLGGGLREKLPPGVVSGPRVFHNHQMLIRYGELPSANQGKFAVIGAGQSAAEVAAFLHEHTDAEVHTVFAKYGYTPADDSPYANRIFDPQAVDEYFGADDKWRDRLMAYHRGTNYSAVDPELIEDLYRREYAEHVSGKRRLFVHGASEVVDVSESADSAHLTIVQRLTGAVTEIDCDAVIFATGFDTVPTSDMLGSLSNRCREDQHGRPVLDRQYRLQTDDDVTGQIFVQGNTEHSHGLTSTLLSNLAVRSGEIVRAVAEDHAAVAGGVTS
ncbi:lysine N(6)-hydroxylase/L-ornithine N(5)-oxygenase family protein [Gordonia sp. CPCC 205333]|uniref:lysine N(6)-hydroxylase/L-ornithine N(5)-oxygenase family protein n=1 Tax=Gordonia sp. CPCC 205333 TaxID=3140790 RepID=UPI003AF35A4E